MPFARRGTLLRRRCTRGLRASPRRCACCAARRRVAHLHAAGVVHGTLSRERALTPADRCSPTSARRVAAPDDDASPRSSAPALHGRAGQRCRGRRPRIDLSRAPSRLGAARRRPPFAADSPRGVLQAHLCTPVRPPRPSRRRAARARPSASRCPGESTRPPAGAPSPSARARPRCAHDPPGPARRLRAGRPRVVTRSPRAIAAAPRPGSRLARRASVSAATFAAPSALCPATALVARADCRRAPRGWSCARVPRRLRPSSRMRRARRACCRPCADTDARALRGGLPSVFDAFRAAALCLSRAAHRTCRRAAAFAADRSPSPARAARRDRCGTRSRLRLWGCSALGFVYRCRAEARAAYSPPLAIWNREHAACCAHRWNGHA